MVETFHLGILGAPGSGKTSLACSASKRAGDMFTPGKTLDVPDVLLLQGDAGGHWGAVDAGFRPKIETMEDDDYDSYVKHLEAVAKNKTLMDGINIVVVDLAPVGRLLVAKYAPTQINIWQLVGAAGIKAFSSYHRLFAGKLMIYCCQIKPMESAVETDISKLAAEARAIGGEKSQFTWDIVKGVARPFIENCSQVLARDAKKIKSAVKDAPVSLAYTTYTAASKRFEVKTRFASKLPPTLPGDMTLRAILNKMEIGHLY
jgi:hypothetical protein